MEVQNWAGGWGWQEVSAHRWEVVLQSGAGSPPEAKLSGTDPGDASERRQCKERARLIPKTIHSQNDPAFLLILKLGSNKRKKLREVDERN